MAFEFNLRGASDAGPSPDAIMQGGLQAEIAGAQMAQNFGAGIERGAQTIFGIVNARYQASQQLAMEMQLAERQNAMRRDMSKMEFRQMLARDAAQDAAAMQRTMMQTQAQMEIAKMGLQREQQEADRKKQAAEALASAQSEVEGLFGQAPKLSVSPMAAAKASENDVRAALGPNASLEQLMQPMEGMYVSPELQQQIIQRLAAGGEKDPQAYLQGRMKTLGAYGSPQAFEEEAAKRYATIIGQQQARPSTSASTTVDRPGLQSWKEQPGDVTQYRGTFEEMPSKDPKAYAQLRLLTKSMVANDPRAKAISNELFPSLPPGWSGDESQRSEAAAAYQQERLQKIEQDVMREVFTSLVPQETADPGQTAQAPAGQQTPQPGMQPVDDSGLRRVQFATRVAQMAKSETGMSNERFLDIMESVAQEMGIDPQNISLEDRQRIVDLYERAK